MNKNICVNCHNNKPVNLTNNRLVTESCGHVKCMDCLLYEKSGCKACAKLIKSKSELLEKNIEEDREDDVNADQIDDPVTLKNSNADHLTPCEGLLKKKKPETSHIKVETDANGRCYYCTECKKRFHARSQVAYHAYCNGQLKPYQCPECNKSFATHSHFKYHMRVHRNERTYACDVCGDSFFQMSKLQRHKLKHTREKNYVCPQCDKAFNNVTSLRKHGLTHTEERPFSCKICNRRFRDGSNYRKHVAKHDGMGAGRVAAARRAFQCPRCPLAFHSNKDMRRHTAVHTDSKPFRCKVCNRSFRRKDNLERHIRNTHPNFVTSSVVECDESALKQITIVNKQTNGQRNLSDEAYQNNEKTRLESLNPLPPLPKEIMQKHIMEINENVSQNNQEGEPEGKIIANKSLSVILEANFARQSVIVGKCPIESKVASVYHESEYIHKMHKANSMVSQNNCLLPPINRNKILELEWKTNSNNLGLGAPPRDRKELYKKILYEKPEIDGCDTIEEDTKAQRSASPEMHWRRKMKLNNIAVDN
ncbi:zinc finger protein 582-like [Achroia grisella]|uniref:zinc finger protein 582-like n=1 Tax=Achroia grisella TaxID=688607 RepID=UPI0027D34270|nr:zinc finger protein 582-like [Achroia grisella]